MVFDDGTSNKLGKKGDIECKVKGIFLYGNITAVHVDNIGQSLEGVEGNPDRQADFPKGNHLVAEKEIKELCCKVKVFKVT